MATPKRRDRRESTLFYTFALYLFRPLLRLFFRVSETGVEHVPRDGPTILAANHCSYIDPLVLGATFPRPIHFVMLRRYWEMPLVGWLSRQAGSFPVDQEGDAIGSLRRALDLLRSDRVFGIFPEGGISLDGALQEGKEGAALIALLSGAPVIPAAISGTFRAFPKGRLLPRPVKVTIRYGSPLRFPPPADRASRREAVAAATARIMEEIRRLSHQQ